MSDNIAPGGQVVVGKRKASLRDEIGETHCECELISGMKDSGRKQGEERGEDAGFFCWRKGECAFGRQPEKKKTPRHGA